MGAVLAEIGAVLDDAISAEGYVIREPSGQPRAGTSDPAVPYSADGLVDLSALDVEALMARFEQGRKHIEAEALRRQVRRRLGQLVGQNRTRMSYERRFQELIEEYNMGSQNVDAFFRSSSSSSRNSVRRRGVQGAKGLSEDELACLDVLLEERPEADKETSGGGQGRRARRVVGRERRPRAGLAEEAASAGGRPARHP